MKFYIKNDEYYKVSFVKNKSLRSGGKCYFDDRFESVELLEDEEYSYRVNLRKSLEGMMHCFDLSTDGKKLVCSEEEGVVLYKR